jgi:hypothetical protein
MGRWGTNLDTDLEVGGILLHWRCVTSCRTGCVDFKSIALLKQNEWLGPRLKLFFSTTQQ